MMPEELLHCSSLRQDFPKHIASHFSGTISRVARRPAWRAKTEYATLAP